MTWETIRQAQQEIAEAAQYYRDKRVGLGDEFLAEIEDSVAKIRDDPDQWPEVRPGIRCYLLDRFPHGVYYRIPDPETVCIIVVKHHHRRPGFGMRRK